MMKYPEYEINELEKSVCVCVCVCVCVYVYMCVRMCIYTYVEKSVKRDMGI
jgi:hypothetical protein